MAVVLVLGWVGVVDVFVVIVLVVGVCPLKKLNSTQSVKIVFLHASWIQVGPA